MNPKPIRAGTVALLLAVSIAGCGGSDNNTLSNDAVPSEGVGTGSSDDGAPVSLDVAVRGLALDSGLTGNPAEGRSLPDITDPVAQLGMKLFFSKGLGAQQDAACVSCHHPMLGGGDDLSLPIGVDAELPDLLGPGRLHSSSGFHFDGGPTVPRNSPTTFNVGLWDQVLFHDGRVESLGKQAGVNGAGAEGIRTPDVAFGESAPDIVNLVQAQALFPVTSPEEMRGLFLEGESRQSLRDALVARFVSQELPNTWLSEFQTAFNSTAAAAELITYTNVSVAIAEYERSQVFVNTSWKSYLEGDDAALTEAQKRGAQLFFTSAVDGGAECSACHSGDFFTDEQFHVLAMPQVGRGKGDGESGSDDFGRLRETGDQVDRYAFRTPSLLNVTATGPWTHAGGYTSLEAVVRHHIDPAAAIDSYDFTAMNLDPGMQSAEAEKNTRAALAKLTELRDAGMSKLSTPTLSDDDVADLVAFVSALTDPCVEDRECLAPWIADRESTGPDSLRLNAVNEVGDSL